MQKLTIIDNPSESRFETQIGDYLAEINYHLDGQRLDLYRTFVPKELGGRGIAGELTQFALKTARQKGLTVIPGCSYIASYIQKHSEFHDLVSN